MSKAKAFGTISCASLLTLEYTGFNERVLESNVHT